MLVNSREFPRGEIPVETDFPTVTNSVVFSLIFRQKTWWQIFSQRNC